MLRWAVGTQVRPLQGCAAPAKVEAGGPRPWVVRSVQKDWLYPATGALCMGWPTGVSGPVAFLHQSGSQHRKSTDDHSLPHPHLAPPDLRTHRSVGHSIARQDFKLIVQFRRFAAVCLARSPKVRVIWVPSG